MAHRREKYYGCCAIIVLVLFILFIVNIINTAHSKPSCYIQTFYVPKLDTFDNPNVSTTNNIIFFNLLFNAVGGGVRYDNINLTIFYGLNASHHIGDYTIQGFRVKGGEVGQKRDIVATHGVPWGDALKAVSNGSTAVFRLDLSTKFELKEWFVYSNKKMLAVGAKVQIDNSGMMVQKKAIKLT